MRKDLIERFTPRVTGWFGNDAPFAFTMPAQTYADTAWRYMGGTPAVAALYQSRAGQTIIGEIGARKIRDKSLVMTQKIIDWVDELGMKLNSPRPAEQRGGSVVFDFVGSADVCKRSANGCRQRSHWWYRSTKPRPAMANRRRSRAKANR